MLCWKPERVADFVADHVFEQAAHQIVGQRQLRRARIERTHLHEIPVAGQVHDVVVELDVGVENLAGARIGDVRAAGVFHRRRQPADHGVADVLRAPVGIFLRGGRGLADDGVPESGGGEGFVPILDAFLQPRHPFLRRGRIDVINDGLHRLGNGGVGVLLFQAPARDVAGGAGAILVGGVIHLRGGEVADALVEQARHHRLFGQPDHAVMQHDGRAVAAHRCRRRALPRPPAAAAAVAGARISGGRFRFDVFGKRAM